MKKLLIAVALTLTITPSVLAQASTNKCQSIQQEIEYYDALINGNALRHDTVFIAKIKLQKQEAERRMFLYKPRK